MKTIRLMLAVLLAALPVLAEAQSTPAPATPPAGDTSKPANPPPPAPAPTFSFSGVLYANYQYRGDEGPAKSTNKFDLERAYFTFRMPAGDRASVRLTADAFQQQTTGSDALYRGWVVRAKYAYLHYDFLKGASWTGGVRGRLLETIGSGRA